MSTDDGLLGADRGAQLHELAGLRATSFAAAVSAAASKARTEREFQIAVDALLSAFAKEAGIELLFRGEFTLATGRADAIYNRLVIEYEAPNTLRPVLPDSRTTHAIKQVKDYLDGLAIHERHARSKLLGVAFDGSTMVYVRWREHAWVVDPALRWDEDGAARLLRSVVSLASGRALTPDNLVEDFGLGNSNSQRAIRALHEALSGHSDDLAGTMFRQWRVFYSEVSGYEHESGTPRQHKDMQALATSLGMRLDGPGASRVLFAIHTYFSFIAKAIATLVLERYAGGGLVTPALATLAQADRRQLQGELAKIEEGGLFRELGFVNLLEGDFFSWYLHTWSDDVAQALQITLRHLADYNPATIEEDPFAARDLLKMLYHRLLPRELRHDLGEYYTPDWLATRLLVQLGEPLFVMPDRHVSRVNLTRRVLDPACGSGTFLVLAVRAIKEHANRQGVSPEETLNLVLRNVVGIDLNPLAVLAARVSYLLAIADLLPFRRAEIAVPVYLADSIVTPAGDGSLLERGRRLQTVVGAFPVPDAVTSAQDLGRLADVLHDYVRDGRSAIDFIARMQEHMGLTEPDVAILHELFDLASRLKREGRDGVWARIIKNAFMPLFIGAFDYVVGNPPWVNWESLPDSYRQQTAPLWQAHGLFVHGGMDTILGKGKKDISTLMTYVAAARYLAPLGKLGFVITQAVFKTSGAAQGFRRFVLPGGESLRVIHVDDMSELQPFEGASNRTAVLILQKGRKTVYPVAYTLWRKTVRGQGLGYNSTLQAVTDMTERLRLFAQPIDPTDSTSPWLTARPKAISAIGRIVGRSDYQAREGVNTGGANGVYWLEVLGRQGDGVVRVRNITEGAKREVQKVVGLLESELVFPLLRPRDLTRWLASPSAHILLVQDPETRRGISIPDLAKHYPLTLAYLSQFEALLRERAAFKRYFTRRQSGTVVESGAFYSMFNVGPYTLSPFKVVINRIASDIEAAVISRDIIPQETITLVPVDTRDEADYVCALLNSVPFRAAAVGYSQAGGKSFGSPHLLENLRIPKFDRSRSAHKRLAQLGASASKQTGGNFEAIESDLGRAVADVWKLDVSQLNELGRALREMRNLAPVLQSQGSNEDNGD